MWSQLAGLSYVEGKLAVYEERGDLEIWLIHPSAQTLTAWRGQPNGSYEETVFREGIVRPASLPEVAIDLAELFAR
jgi:hypothetical protein